MDDRKKLIEQIVENVYPLRQKIMSELHSLFKALGITHTQMMVLRIIQQNENTNLKDLAAILGTTNSATTQIVNGLVKKGFLIRKRNPEDRRWLNIKLSDKAKLQFDEMKTRSFNALYYLFDILNNDELLEYYRLSAKILGSKVEKTISGKDNSACSG